jgi:hypothetical protein
MTDKGQSSEPIDWKNRLLQFYFLNHRSVLRYGAAVLAITLLTIFWGTRDGGTSHKARTLFEQWKKTPGDASLTREMERALRKAPHIRRVLEAEIVQGFLNVGDVENADKRAAGCIARLQDDLPLHAEFARISLLIEQEKYQKALEASVTLKERLEKVEAASRFQGWNLLRLAVLHKKLQNPSGELAAWEEVRGFMQQNPAGKSLEAGIGWPEFSLMDFIAHREREIDET